MALELQASHQRPGRFLLSLARGSHVERVDVHGQRLQHAAPGTSLAFARSEATHRHCILLNNVSAGGAQTHVWEQVPIANNVWQHSTWAVLWQLDELVLVHMR
jgi:hypothetical protein